MMLPTKRWQHFVAMTLIGDGMMALVHPQRDAAAWHMGPEPWQKLMRSLHNRPNLTRIIGAAQIAGGVWWALQQESKDSPEQA